MAVTIVATAGSASANSFVTLAEADSYAESRLNASTWETDATADAQNRALVEATRELSAVRWLGYRTDDVQALAWPRQWVVNVDDPNFDYYATTVVPQRVKDATCELALAFTKAGTTDLAALPSDDGVIERTVDVLTTRWAEPYQRKTGLARFPRVIQLIAPLLESAGITTPVVRG